jgi:predicted ester cyclase
MSELKDLMTNVYAEMSATDDVNAMVDKYFAVDFVEHDTIPGIEAEGRELARMMFGMMKSGIPDIRVEIDLMVEEGSKVAAFGAFVGTFTGEMMGMTGQGQQVRMPFADVLEWRNGQLVAHWGVSDMSALFDPPS